MIETISKQPGLGIRRFLARRMAREAGRKTLAPDNPRGLARARMDKAGDRLPCAPSVTIETAEIAGRKGLVFMPANPRPGVIVFFHGGGYSLGSPQSHKPFISHLSAALGLKAYAPDYRLAPEHVCPAAVEDGADALAQICKENDGPMLVAGDSAGGGLTLASVMAHRDAGRDMPKGLYLMSPWVDLTLSGQSMVSRADCDPMLTPHALARATELYLDGRDPTDTAASPLLGDLSGLPPTLIQVGDHEVLLDDSIRLAGRMNEAGVTVRCEVWDDMFHDFQLFSPLLPEAAVALEHVKAWAGDHL